MTTQNVETVASKTDFAIVAVAVLAAAAGVLAFTFLSEQPTLVRVGALIGGLAVGVAIAWLSEPGKRFLAYAASPIRRRNGSSGRRARRRSARRASSSASWC